MKGTPITDEDPSVPDGRDSAEIIIKYETEIRRKLISSYVNHGKETIDQLQEVKLLSSFKAINI